MICATSPFPHANRTPGFRHARTPSGHNGHLIPPIHGVCVHGDYPRHTPDVREHNTDHVKHLHRNLILATDPSLRTSRPPPCRILPGRLLKTAEHLGQTIAAFPHSRRTFLVTILQFSILQCLRLSNGRTSQQHQVREQTVRSSTFLWQGAVS